MAPLSLEFDFGATPSKADDDAKQWLGVRPAVRCQRTEPGASRQPEKIGQQEEGNRTDGQENTLTKDWMEQARLRPGVGLAGNRAGMKTMTRTALAILVAYVLLANGPVLAKDRITANALTDRTTLSETARLRDAFRAEGRSKACPLFLTTLTRSGKGNAH